LFFILFLLLAENLRKRKKEKPQKIARKKKKKKKKEKKTPPKMEADTPGWESELDLLASMFPEPGCVDVTRGNGGSGAVLATVDVFERPGDVLGVRLTLTPTYAAYEAAADAAYEAEADAAYEAEAACATAEPGHPHGLGLAVVAAAHAQDPPPRSDLAHASALACAELAASWSDTGGFAVALAASIGLRAAAEARSANLERRESSSTNANGTNAGGTNANGTNANGTNADGTNADGTESSAGSLWLRSHHIYSSKKRRSMARWASELGLSGLVLTGRPGVIAVAGAPPAVAEFSKVRKKKKKLFSNARFFFVCPTIPTHPHRGKIKQHPQITNNNNNHNHNPAHAAGARDALAKDRDRGRDRRRKQRGRRAAPGRRARPFRRV
jgi:hypothetical protein